MPDYSGHIAYLQFASISPKRQSHPFLVIAVFHEDPEGHSYDAAVLAEQRRERLLVEGRSSPEC